MNVIHNQPHNDDINVLLRQRRSTHAFSEQLIPPADLQRLFEAGRWSASSSNEQPWRFIYATRDDEHAFQRIAGTLSDSNSLWAPHAAVLIVSVAKRHKGEHGRENRFAYYDVGQAVASLVLQALDMGLLARQMGAFSQEKAREVLHIPDGYDPVTIIAVGYPGDVMALPESVQAIETAPRTRKPLTEIVFRGEWG